MSENENRPVKALCDEIEFDYTEDMERSEVFISFVKVLVDQIRDMREIQVRIVRMTNKPPSELSLEVLKKVDEMLCFSDVDAMIVKAQKINNTLCFEHGEIDRLGEMLQGCVSAIQFGLKKPCRSRHAAHAADYVWKNRYGITCFDKFTSGWCHEWARAQMTEALSKLKAKEK